MSLVVYQNVLRKNDFKVLRSLVPSSSLLCWNLSFELCLNSKKVLLILFIVFSFTLLSDSLFWKKKIWYLSFCSFWSCQRCPLLTFFLIFHRSLSTTPFPDIPLPAPIFGVLVSLTQTLTSVCQSIKPWCHFYIVKSSW